MQSIRLGRGGAHGEGDGDGGREPFALPPRPSDRSRRTSTDWEPMCWCATGCDNNCPSSAAQSVGRHRSRRRGPPGAGEQEGHPALLPVASRASTASEGVSDEAQRAHRSARLVSIISHQYLSLGTPTRRSLSSAATPTEARAAGLADPGSTQAASRGQERRPRRRRCQPSDADAGVRSGALLEALQTVALSLHRGVRTMRPPRGRDPRFKR